MRRWTILAFAMFTIVCLMETTTVTPVIVEVKEEPFIEPTATPVCQHADGVTLDVRRIRDTTVMLHASGLQPGERPTVIYSTFSNTGSAMAELGYFAEGADEYGELSVDLLGLMPLEGQISANWDIRFIHLHGVECATITLP